MGKQANILSFDEVKRGASVQRSSAVVPKKSSRSRYSRTPYLEASAAYPSRNAAPSRKVSGRTSVPLEQEREEEVVPEKESRIKEMRRKRQKDRADKKFDKQFGGVNKSSDTSSSGSRAAVYKGEMGSTHRRSSRMQNEGAATRTSTKRSPWGALAAFRKSPKFIASIAVVVCFVLACGFLYPPAQQFYHSVREHDRLQAEYAALEQRNSSLQSDVAALTTESGIEDRAHAQFGWVAAGQQTAYVKGLSENEAEASSFTANIIPGSVEAPTTWYSPFLDAIFGAK